SAKGTASGQRDLPRISELALSRIHGGEFPLAPGVKNADPADALTLAGCPRAGGRALPSCASEQHRSAAGDRVLHYSAAIGKAQVRRRARRGLGRWIVAAVHQG